MRAAMKIVFLSLLLSVAPFAQKASAAIVELTNLPDSSYAAAVDNWQGYSIYTETTDEGDFDAVIEFAVYDTEMRVIDTYEYDFVDELVDDFGLTGQYIYAYQVFQQGGGGYADIGYFGILKDGQTVNGTDVTAMSDDQPYSFTGEGQAPDESINTPISWKWYALDPLVTGEHSWFLVFSSDFAPVIGEFVLEGPSGEISDPPIDGDDVIPEPATIVLLGFGGATIFSRRRKSV